MFFLINLKNRGNFKIMQRVKTYSVQEFSWKLKIVKEVIFYLTKYSIGIHSHFIILVSDEHIGLDGYACDLYLAVTQFDL